MDSFTIRRLDGAVCCQPPDRASFQPLREMSLQICCKRSRERCQTQLLVAAGGTPERRLSLAEEAVQQVDAQNVERKVTTLAVTVEEK